MEISSELEQRVIKEVSLIKALTPDIVTIYSKTQLGYTIHITVPLAKLGLEEGEHNLIEIDH
jgi:hypothetical protein